MQKIKTDFLKMFAFISTQIEEIKIKRDTSNISKCTFQVIFIMSIFGTLVETGLMINKQIFARFSRFVHFKGN